MEPYQWMVEWTPQKEWIDRKGLLIWLAEVSAGLGGGLYLVGAYFGLPIVMLISWLIIIAFKGGFHFAYLGHPLRFWRMGLKPGTSWVARGFIFMALFIIFGAVQLVLSYWLPGTPLETLFRVIAAVMAFLIAINFGFVLNYVNAIPLWNSGLLPLILVVCGVLDGLAVMIVISSSGGGSHLETARMGSQLLLIANAFLITLYLWSVSYTGNTGKRSVIEILRGRIAPILWIGVVLCGIVTPLGISVYSYFTGEAYGALLIATVCEMTGVLSLKYSILKAGLYVPLI
jgi:formate-dependent nitrite reductase membrane component NrfD